MKVDNHSINDSAAVSVNRSQQADQATSSSRPHSHRRVDASQDSVQISGLAGVVGQEAARRAHRVEQLANDVQSGNYKPDPAAVSSAIVKAALNAEE